MQQRTWAIFGRPEQGLTPRAKRVIERAAEDATGLGHCYVGTEHLLMGILRESDCAAARVLVALGSDLDELYTNILDVFGRPQPGRLLCKKAFRRTI